MLGNGKLKAKIEELEKALENAIKERDIARKEAKENWKKYEEIFYKTQSSTISIEEHKKQIHKLLNDVENLDGQLGEAYVLLEEEQRKHKDTQNLLDRKKQQCKRYKRKIEKLSEKA